jgi:hypothetical protein
MALDTTIGGASSDSYVTAVEYAAYIVANIDASYSGVTATQELNLRRAAQYLSRNFRWIGSKQYQTQARAWPRLTDKLVDGWPVDPDTIPQAVKDAQCELAYIFEVDGVDPYAAITTGAVKVSRSKAGPVEAETEYFDARQSPRFPAVTGLLSDYTLGGSGQVRVLRG